MDGRECLIRQLRHHYLLVDRGIAEITYERSLYQFTPSRPSIAWLLSHLTNCSDSVAEAICELPPKLDAEFQAGRDLPHWGVDSERRWRERRELWTSLSARTLSGVEGMSSAELDLPPAVEIRPNFRAMLPTRTSFLAGHVFHVAYHLGQLGNLRAEHGLGFPAG